jgi:hypothetical protein
MAKQETNKIERLISKLKNHPVITVFTLAGIVIIWLGTVAGGVNKVVDVWERIFGSAAPSSLITVNLPSNLTFKQAVQLLVEDARAGAKFDHKCPSKLMGAVVKSGEMRGRTVTDLLEQLRYRVLTGQGVANYRINVLMEGGVYEISCGE